MATSTSMELAGFTVLPVRFPKTKVFEGATHYIYLKPHDPRLPDPSANRSLFLVNVPVTTTENHLKHLFNTQLGAGRVEDVFFGEARSQKASVISQAQTSQQKKNKKRKRETIEDYEAALEACELPPTWSNEIHPSGSHAIVSFVDRSSMEASLKAAKKASKKNLPIPWTSGEDTTSQFGLPRYTLHSKLRYPARRELLHSVDSYITAFNNLQQSRLRLDAKQRSLPDADGFITVTRGSSRSAVLTSAEANQLSEKQKSESSADKGLQDFYRFQTRQKRKEDQGALIRQFEQDRKKIDEMRQRRGKLRPET